MNITEKSRRLLHQWLNKNFISAIRKGMTEDLEAFALEVSAEFEATKVALKMQEHAIQEHTEDKKSEE